MSKKLKEDYYCPFQEYFSLERAHDRLDARSDLPAVWPKAPIRKELENILFCLSLSEERRTRMLRTKSFWEAVARLQRLEFVAREYDGSDRTVPMIDRFGQKERQ